MYRFVNSNVFNYTWFILSLSMLGYTSIVGFNGWSILFVLTLIEAFLDIFIEYGFSKGISRRLLIYNGLSNLLGVLVQFSYGLYGGAVTSLIGFVLMLHKVVTWDSRKDGNISKFKREEFTIATVMILVGVLLLGCIYGFISKGSQPMWLVSLNVLIFCLGFTGRLLLINGKTLSQYIYVVRELVNIGILVAVVYLGLTEGNIFIRFASSISTLLILWKSVINWEVEQSCAKS